MIALKRPASQTQSKTLYGSRRFVIECAPMATALNRFTLALVIVGAVGLIPQAVSIGFTFWTHFHR
jgi:hypothetical protein